MQPLDKDFLVKIARKYNLSAEQEEVFLELFSTGKSQQAIAEALHISPSALRTRMTGVYQKFSFTDKKPNKSRRLHDWLLKQYQAATSKSAHEAAIDNADIEQLVAIVRENIKANVKERCGKMQVLDMTQPIGLNDIYTNVNILEKITAIRRLSLGELQEICKFDLEQLDRVGLGNIAEKRVAGIEAVRQHSKLVIWGKPGAGKTTFLKYLGIECILGEFKQGYIPIFITLKNFAEVGNNYNLVTFIANYLAQFEIPKTKTVKLLQAGKLLIFLDGLDEVRKEDSNQVIKQIQAVADRHSQNQFVVTCRIAAREYTFQGFTEVEIADFDLDQIKAFVNNWFRIKDPVKADKFLTKLADKKSIQELATNPLLLTLLCLVFAEKLDFTANRAELYEEGIDILLRKWDADRNIERDEVYRRLTLKRKKDLLSKIAFTSFEDSTYFFKQKTVEKYIADYIQNLPDAQTDESALLLDSQQVLQSIVAQHGLLVPRAKNIYSFSHLTFHEYFTARQIIEVDKSTELVLENLVEHLFEKSWREVFFLAVEMSSNADLLVRLMKHKIDSLLADDPKLQEFLTWLNQKSLAVNATFSPQEVAKIQNRLDFIVNHDLSLSRTLYLDLSRTLYLDLDLDLYLDLDLSLDLSLDLYLDLDL